MPVGIGHRYQRDPLTGADQRERGRRVGAVTDDDRREPGQRAGPGQRLVGSGRFAHRDPPLLGQFGQAGGGAAHRVAAGRRHQHRLHQQVAPLQPGVQPLGCQPILGDHRHVHPAAQQCRDALAGLELLDPDIHVGRHVPEPGQGVGQDDPGRAGHDPDSQQAYGPTVDRTDARLHPGQPVEHLAGLTGQPPARRGQPPGAGVTVEQARAKVAFEPGELLGERRRGGSQGSGRCLQSPVVVHRDKRPQSNHIEHGRQANGRRGQM